MWRVLEKGIFAEQNQFDGDRVGEASLGVQKVHDDGKRAGEQLDNEDRS